MDELLKAAVAWKELLEIKYLMIYGKNRKLRKICLSFTEDRFAHIAGFQHLSDISLPVMGSKRKRLNQVLNEDIKQQDIEKVCTTKLWLNRV